MEKIRYFFPAYDQPVKNKFDIWRGIADGKLTAKARLRLEWIVFYYSIGKKNAKLTAAHFGISRKTFHKWLSRWKDNDLTSLEELSRAPIHVRKWEVTLVEEERIRTLRKRHKRYGKAKIARRYQEVYQEQISTWKVERVIRKWKLYPEPDRHLKLLKKRASSSLKARINQLEKKEAYGFLWHIDAIILWWYGQRRVIFTAIEELTKIGYARIYSTNSSGYAGDFLNRLRYLVEGKVEVAHTDNGAEFAGAFEKACQALGIQQVYSRPRTPKDNPALERFNRTVQEEWLVDSEVGLDEITSANYDLTEWLVEYNSIRPHQSLAYQTPLQYAQEHFFQVLPMWSASTGVVL